MRISSPNGSPPRRITRAGPASEFVTVRADGPGRHVAEFAPRAGSCPTRSRCLGPRGRRARSSGRRRAWWSRLRSTTISAPSSGVNVATGDVLPARRPRKTRATAPSSATGAGTWCSKFRAVWRSLSGRAIHSCTPCRTVVSGVETSEWQMPRPPVMRLSSPGRIDGVDAEAVAVLDLPREEPADRLQSGVRVRRDVHSSRDSDIVGTVVVGEAPRADEGSLAAAAASGGRSSPVGRRGGPRGRPRTSTPPVPGAPPGQVSSTGTVSVLLM